MAIEAELKNRKGRPSKNNPQNFAELKGKDTREIAAEKAGYKNHTTYEQAKKVVQSGVPELVNKMDSGDVSISAASTIAGLDDFCTN